MTLLPQINPILPVTHPDMAALQLQHSHQICGIVAHVKDRGVASVALRSLAIAAEVLTERAEQEEVLNVFEKIRKETGWKIGFLYNELKEKWGWNREEAAQAALLQQQQNGSLAAFFPNNSGAANGAITAAATILPPAPSQPSVAAIQARMRAMVNPLKQADFSLPNHPYQQHYQPPNPNSGPLNSITNNWFS
jgi:hypothetical protein